MLISWRSLAARPQFHDAHPLRTFIAPQERARGSQRLSKDPHNWIGVQTSLSISSFAFRSRTGLARAFPSIICRNTCFSHVSGLQAHASPLRVRHILHFSHYPHFSHFPLLPHPHCPSDLSPRWVQCPPKSHATLVSESTLTDPRFSFARDPNVASLASQHPPSVVTYCRSLPNLGDYKSRLRLGVPDHLPRGDSHNQTPLRSRHALFPIRMCDPEGAQAMRNIIKEAFPSHPPSFFHQPSFINLLSSINSSA